MVEAKGKQIGKRAEQVSRVALAIQNQTYYIDDTLLAEAIIRHGGMKTRLNSWQAWFSGSVTPDRTRRYDA